MTHMISRQAEEWLTLMGSEIKKMRLQHGISIKSMAARIGVSQPTISALEAGSPSVAVGTVFEAAAVLNIQMMGDRDSIRDRVSMNKAMIKLMPRPSPTDVEETNEDQIPSNF